jgi:hypothetical protein
MVEVTSRPMLILALIVLTIILVAFLLRKFALHVMKSIPGNAKTWREYLRGQGTLVFLALFVGAALSWGTWAFEHYELGTSDAEKGGRLAEFRDVDPSEHPVYEEIQAKGYRRITVMTRTTAPENASATVTLYGDQDGIIKSEIKRIVSVASGWTRWDHQNEDRNISLVIESANQAGGSKTTKVDVLIYLSNE